MLKPTMGRSFQDYAIHTFVPYICNLLREVQRIDIVWDRYFENSLKNCTRNNRGAGVRRKVTGNSLLSENWKTFLRCSENKAELFPFLSNIVVEKINHKVVISTVNENVVSNVAGFEMSELMPCNMDKLMSKYLYMSNIHQLKTLA